MTLSQIPLINEYVDTFEESNELHSSLVYNMYLVFTEICLNLEIEIHLINLNNLSNAKICSLIHLK